MTDDELVRVSKKVFENNVVICDSADPKTIDYLAMNNINAIPAAKGADSINRGIRWLQGYESIRTVKTLKMRLNSITGWRTNMVMQWLRLVMRIITC